MYEEIKLLDGCTEKVIPHNMMPFYCSLAILCSWMSLKTLQLLVVKEKIRLMIQKERQRERRKRKLMMKQLDNRSRAHTQNTDCGNLL